MRRTVTLLQLREHRRFLDAVGVGLADVEAGRVLTTPEIKKSLEGVRADRVAVEWSERARDDRSA